MLNKDFNSKRITNMAVIGDKLALVNGEIYPCAIGLCERCDMYVEGECNIGVLINWAYSEVTNQLDDKEYNFLKAVQTGYLARDKSGDLFWYLNKPESKSDGIWVNPAGSEVLKVYPMFGKFSFIHMYDEIPYKVEDMLKWREEK